MKNGFRRVGIILFGILAMGAAKPDSAGIYGVPLLTLAGKPVTLASYRGKVLLVVNTASECGYTPQYKGLQELHEKYEGKGLVVLGFPSNDFGGQEPGTADQIGKFCERNYGVKFPLFAKGPVSGAAKQPLFAWLLQNSQDKSEVRWNFEKFLIGPDGQVLARYRSDVTPTGSAIEDRIRRLLER